MHTNGNGCGLRAGKTGRISAPTARTDTRARAHALTKCGWCEVPDLYFVLGLIAFCLEGMSLDERHGEVGGERNLTSSTSPRPAVPEVSAPGEVPDDSWNNRTSRRCARTVNLSFPTLSYLYEGAWLHRRQQPNNLLYTVHNPQV